MRNGDEFSWYVFYWDGIDGLCDRVFLISWWLLGGGGEYVIVYNRFFAGCGIRHIARGIYRLWGRGIEIPRRWLLLADGASSAALAWAIPRAVECYEGELVACVSTRI